MATLLETAPLWAWLALAALLGALSIWIYWRCQADDEREWAETVIAERDAQLAEAREALARRGRDATPAAMAASSGLSARVSALAGAAAVDGAARGEVSALKYRAWLLERELARLRAEPQSAAAMAAVAPASFGVEAEDGGRAFRLRRLLDRALAAGRGADRAELERVAGEIEAEGVLAAPATPAEAWPVDLARGVDLTGDGAAESLRYRNWLLTTWLGRVLDAARDGRPIDADAVAAEIKAAAWRGATVEPKPSPVASAEPAPSDAERARIEALEAERQRLEDEASSLRYQRARLVSRLGEVAWAADRGFGVDADGFRAALAADGFADAAEAAAEPAFAVALAAPEAEPAPAAPAGFAFAPAAALEAAAPARRVGALEAEIRRLRAEAPVERDRMQAEDRAASLGYRLWLAEAELRRLRPNADLSDTRLRESAARLAAAERRLAASEAALAERDAERDAWLDERARLTAEREAVGAARAEAEAALLATTERLGLLEVETESRTATLGWSAAQDDAVARARLWAARSGRETLERALSDARRRLQEREAALATTKRSLRRVEAALTAAEAARLEAEAAYGAAEAARLTLGEDERRARSRGAELRARLWSAEWREGDRLTAESRVAEERARLMGELDAARAEAETRGRAMATSEEERRRLAAELERLEQERDAQAARAEAAQAQLTALEAARPTVETRASFAAVDAPLGDQPAPQRYDREARAERTYEPAPQPYPRTEREGRDATRDPRIYERPERESREYDREPRLYERQEWASREWRERAPREDFTPRQDFTPREDFAPRQDFTPRQEYTPRQEDTPRENFTRREDAPPRREDLPPRREWELRRDDAPRRDSAERERRDQERREVDWTPRGRVLERAGSRLSSTGSGAPATRSAERYDEDDRLTTRRVAAAAPRRVSAASAARGFVRPALEAAKASALTAAERDARDLIAEGAVVALSTNRPAALLARPAADRPTDDLKLVDNVSEKLESLMNGFGLYYFAQFEAFNGRDLAWVDDRLGLRGAVVSERWAAQAARLAELRAAGRLGLGADGSFTADEATLAGLDIGMRGAAVDAPLTSRVDLSGEVAPARAEAVAIKAPLWAQEIAALEILDDDAAAPAARPALFARRDARRDDLTLIAGVNDRLAEALAEEGVVSFDQLAEMTGRDAAWLDRRLGLRGRVVGDRWIPQARHWADRIAREGAAAFRSWEIVEREVGAARVAEPEPEPEPAPADWRPAPDDLEIDAIRLQEEGLAPELLTAPLPGALDAPRDGVADDLKLISGVGAKLEQRLNAEGVFHFDQIGDADALTLALMDATLQLGGRLWTEEWVSQARILDARRQRGGLRIGGERRWTVTVDDAGWRALVDEARAAAPTAAEVEARALLSEGFAADRDAIPAEVSARAGVASPDPLSLIEGVGAALERDLNALGVVSFAQLAELSGSSLAWLDAALALDGRVVKERWAAQAAALARSKF